jgi:hypothetical protein
MTVRTVLVALVVMALLSPGLTAKLQEAEIVGDSDIGSRPPAIFWFDNMESGVNGWTTVDETAIAIPHFHVDTYMAYDANHWWCGSFAYDINGGYGNSWTDLLVIPTTDMSAASYPILTFVHYFDSEPGYDFTYVDVKISGIFVAQNAGYNGQIPGGTWVDLGAYGFILAGADNPVEARFRFASDGAWSDEDGDYDSVGGAYMVDNVKLFDFYGGTVYFLDDVESGGLCTPSVPAASGDYWHQITRLCPAYSDPTSWWCGDDADTSLIPPDLCNSLISPQVDISYLAPASTCTLFFALHAEVPTVDNDYWTESITTDGGTTWYGLGAWWGDFEQCDGWGLNGLSGIDLTSFLPGTFFQFKLTFNTTDNGCGPGAAGGAGIMLDDTWLEETEIPVERSSWGLIKSFYR